MMSNSSVRMKGFFVVILMTAVILSAEAAGELPAAFTPDEAAAVIESSWEVADVASVDFSGEWTGTRYQYTHDRLAVMKEFNYSFQLEQNGSSVRGISVINNNDGEFAVIELKGYVVGNKLHFMEYRIQDETKREHMTWCYKIGELQLSENNDEFIMHGPTNSYTAEYYLPCSGGFTVLEKDKPSELVVTEREASVEEIERQSIVSFMDLSVYPNPYSEFVNLTYGLKTDAKVQLEIYDMAGHRLQTIVSGEQAAGVYSYEAGGSEAGFAAGAYIARLQVNDKVYSKQIIQSR